MHYQKYFHCAVQFQISLIETPLGLYVNKNNKLNELYNYKVWFGFPKDIGGKELSDQSPPLAPTLFMYFIKIFRNGSLKLSYQMWLTDLRKRSHEIDFDQIVFYVLIVPRHFW